MMSRINRDGIRRELPHIVRLQDLLRGLETLLNHVLTSSPQRARWLAEEISDMQGEMVQLMEHHYTGPGATHRYTLEVHCLVEWMQESNRRVQAVAAQMRDRAREMDSLERQVHRLGLASPLPPVPEARPAPARAGTLPTPLPLPPWPGT